MELIGQTIHKQYRIIERIGEGGMGVVYRARKSGNTENASIAGLMPEKVAANDLVVTIQQLILSFESSEMKIDFEVDNQRMELYNPYSDVIYRICQEALTNALRHGKARNTSIILKNSDYKIKLYIVDDGYGCKDIKKGIGMAGMEKRVRDLNGSFSYGSDGENGFNIRVEIPVGSEKKDD